MCFIDNDTSRLTTKVVSLSLMLPRIPLRCVPCDQTQLHVPTLADLDTESANARLPPRSFPPLGVPATLPSPPFPTTVWPIS